jgi:site-specific recombinase XerD
VSLPVSAIAALEEHRKVQEEFRRQFGPEYRADLDLIFANPDGSPFKPDSISAAVSLLFRRLKLPKGASLHSLRHSHCSHLLARGVPESPRERGAETEWAGAVKWRAIEKRQRV